MRFTYSDGPRKRRGDLRKGTVRKDGMIFWSYSPSCIGGQRWLTRQAYDKLSAFTKAYYQKNKKKTRARDSARRAENPDHFKRIAERTRARPHVIDWLRSYAKKNILKIRAYRIKHNRKVRADPVRRLAKSVSTRLGMAIKGMGFTKISRTQEYAGCSWTFLKTYIESRFLPGMSWDNHSVMGWHIDHIIPISTAKTGEDVKRLSHYTNLQPLWAKDNRAKGDRLLATGK